MALDIPFQHNTVSVPFSKWFCQFYNQTTLFVPFPIVWEGKCGGRTLMHCFMNVWIQPYQPLEQNKKNLPYGRPLKLLKYADNSAPHPCPKNLCETFRAQEVPNCKEPGLHMGTLSNIMGRAVPSPQTETGWSEKVKYLCLPASLAEAPHFLGLLCWKEVAS